MNCEDVYVKTSFLVQGSHMWSNLIEVGTEISADLKLGFKSDLNLKPVMPQNRLNLSFQHIQLILDGLLF